MPIRLRSRNHHAEFLSLMIVEADFVSHWKTLALAKALGEGRAFKALLSLWGHCQTRRAWEFQLTPDMLASICRFTGKPAALWEVMLTLPFLDRTAEEGWYQVHGWGDTNISLVAKWAGGLHLKAGQYPPRGALHRAKLTPQLPSKLPSNLPSQGRAIGLDGIGEDRMGWEGRGLEAPPPLLEPPPAALPENSEVDLPPVEEPDLAEKKKGAADLPDLTVYLALAESHAKGSPDGFSIPPAFVRHWHDIRVARDWERGNGQPIPNTEAARWADLKAMAREEHHRGGLVAYASSGALRSAQKKKAAATLAIGEPEGDWRKFCREVLLFEPAGDWASLALRLQQEIWNAWQSEKNRDEGEDCQNDEMMSRTTDAKKL